MMNWLSIVIPVYRYDKELEHCLATISRSDIDFSEVEVILSLNGQKISNNDLSKWPFKIISSPARNVSVARNAGVKEAKGTFVLFLDSDVLIPSFFFSELKTYIQNLNIPFSGIQFSVIPFSTEISWRRTREDHRRNEETRGTYNSFVGGFSIPKVDSCFFLMKRCDFLELGGFPEYVERGEDRILTYTVLEAGPLIIPCTEISGKKLLNERNFWSRLKGYWLESKAVQIIDEKYSTSISRKERFEAFLRYIPRPESHPFLNFLFSLAMIEEKIFMPMALFLRNLTPPRFRMIKAKNVYRSIDIADRIFHFNNEEFVFYLNVDFSGVVRSMKHTIAFPLSLEDSNTFIDLFVRGKISSCEILIIQFLKRGANQGWIKSSQSPTE